MSDARPDPPPDPPEPADEPEPAEVDTEGMGEADSENGETD